jgi:regulation of enolase protein 1 (concanavalin A-like superfamily)
MFPEDTEIAPNLTVAMNDQALFGHGHSPLPPGAVVRLRSNRPGVVSVAPGGTLRTGGNGVATVTATVSLNGVSRSGQFVVRVLSQLGALLVNGQPVPHFYPDSYDYSELVPASVRHPRISAAAAGSGTGMRIHQAAGVPGTASVTTTGPDGISFTYLIHFAAAATGNAFTSGRLGSGWSWIRSDPANVHLAPGVLTIAAQPGDLNPHTTRNLLVAPALGDWTLQSRLQFSAIPHAPTQQAGLLAYQDDENYLKLDVEYSGGAVLLSETTSDGLSGTPVTQVLTSLPAPALTNGIWLRMVKQGPRYTTFFSTDGRHFAELYNTGTGLTGVNVGLFADAGAYPTTDVAASFTGLVVRNTGPTVAAPPKPPPKKKKGTGKKSHPKTRKSARLPGALNQHRGIGWTRPQQALRPGRDRPWG